MAPNPSHILRRRLPLERVLQVSPRLLSHLWTTIRSLSMQSKQLQWTNVNMLTDHSSGWSKVFLRDIFDS